MVSANAIAPVEKIAPSYELPPLRILIVEDDPFTLTIMQKRVTLGGYDVVTAVNGLLGLEQVEAFHPDLIISDWMMPEMDGQEFCERVKANTRGQSIYFILLTAKDKYEDKVSALDTGADEYLVKPCDGRELMARIRAAERILRLQKQLSRSNQDLQQALKRINAELEATSMIQRRLLPQSLPKVPGLDFAAHYQPSTECSGDFYDALALPDGRLALVIGDVSGHGTPAMVAMALIHMLVHQEAMISPDPATLLFNLNNKMCAFLPTDQYVTVFYGILDPTTGQLIYSSAGHNPPLKVDDETHQCEFLSGCEGFPIKLIGPGMTYENREIHLTSSQHLILYTDGLIEGFNPEGDEFGSAGVTQCLQKNWNHNPHKIIEMLLEDLHQFINGHPLEDDLSLFIVSLVNSI